MNSNPENSFYLVSIGHIEVQDYLENEFKIPAPFKEDQTNNGILLLPTFLKKNSEFQKLLDKDLDTKADSFRGIEFSDLLDMRKEYRDQIENIYSSIELIYDKIAKGFISQFEADYRKIERKEKARKEKLFYKIKSLFKRQLPPKEESDQRELFLDELTSLSDFFENIVYGMEIPKALDTLGYLPEKNFSRQLLKPDSPINIKEEFEKKLKNIPEDRKMQKRVDLFSKYGEQLRKKYQEKLQKRLRFVVGMITVSDSLSVLNYDFYQREKEKYLKLYFKKMDDPKKDDSKKIEEAVSNTEIKTMVDNQERLKQIRKKRKDLREYENQNALLKLEKLRSKVIPFMFKYIAIQKAINTTNDLNLLMEKFAKWYANKSKKGFSTDAIQTYVELYESNSFRGDEGKKETLDPLTDIISKSKGKCDELKEMDPTYDTFKNIKEEWNKFLGHAQQ